MEKSIRKYAFMAAALLAGPIALTSCSSDDEAADVNPTFDGNSVKTQFAINVPHAVGTRMTAANTQNNNNFLGMTDVRLIPFTGEIGASTDIANTISLGEIGTSEISTTQSSKVYQDVNVPVGTNHFLFYGRAIGNDAFANGKLIATIDRQTNTSNISFALDNVLEDNTTVSNDALTTVLSNVAKVNGWDTSTGNLGELYKDFITLKAGSANSIRLALEDLYNSVQTYNTEATGEIAVLIQTAIVQGGTFTVSGAAPNATLSTANDFPASLNLPDGAVTLSFDESSKTFSYANLSSIGGTTNVDVTNITYPASLYYWVSTDLKATNSENVTWPQTTSAWETGFTSWTDTEVKATTRAIALKENINYGVADLALSVKCATATLPDKEVTDANNNTSRKDITVPTGGFPVTAILVGGQPTSRGYNFGSVSSTTYVKTVYDKIADNTVTSASTVNDDNVPVINHTLLLPTTGDVNKKVNFALELVNNSTEDFHGADGKIIPVGGKFYLIGQLDATTSTLTGVTADDLAVFMSDYKTTARVKISSLENAYNTIPDLRAAGLQLGLSVDLEWKTGITFDVEIE